MDEVFEGVEESLDEMLKEPMKVLVEKHWPIAVWIIAVAEVGELVWLVFG